MVKPRSWQATLEKARVTVDKQPSAHDLLQARLMRTAIYKYNTTEYVFEMFDAAILLWAWLQNNACFVHQSVLMRVWSNQQREDKHMASQVI